MDGNREITGQTDTVQYEVIMLATPQIETYAWLAKANWRDYCLRHGYRFTVFDTHIVPDMHINWSRIEAMRHTLSHSDNDFVVLVDADTVVLRPELPLSHFCKNNRDITFASDAPFPRAKPDFRAFFLKLRLARLKLPNGGFVLVRRNAFTVSFFTEWLDLGRGRLSHWADIHPRNQNVLWRGLLPRYGNKISILDKEVLRVTSETQIPRIKLYDPFIVHYKHETVAVEKIIPLLPQDYQPPPPINPEVFSE